jgi:hypothetical protein
MTLRSLAFALNNKLRYEWRTTVRIASQRLLIETVEPTSIGRKTAGEILAKDVVSIEGNRVQWGQYLVQNAPVLRGEAWLRKYQPRRVFVKIDIGHEVPHLFLDSRSNTTRFVSEYYDAQALYLEGNFSQYFTLYAPPNYQIDALQFLTPDVMATVLQYGWTYDFELVDRTLYVFTTIDQANNAQTIKWLLVAAEKIAEELRHQASNYHSHHGANEGNFLRPRQLAMYIRGNIVDFTEGLGLVGAAVGRSPVIGVIIIFIDGTIINVVFNRNSDDEIYIWLVLGLMFLMAILSSISRELLTPKQTSIND